MAFTPATLKPVAEYPLRAGIGKFTYKTEDILKSDPVATTDIANAGSQYFKPDKRITEDGAIIEVVSINSTLARSGYAKLFVRRRPPTIDGLPWNGVPQGTTVNTVTSNANTNIGDLVTIVLEDQTALTSVTS